MTLEHIERLAGQYADAYEFLADEVGKLNAEIEALKRKRLPAIRRSVRAAAGCHDKLHAALKEAPELFAKPKTRVLAGVKVGFRKQKGEVSFGDEETVIKRIRAQLPKAQADLLVRVRESVDKNACYDLKVDDLKRLGISVANDDDVPVIKPADSEVDKLVAALLKDAIDIEEAAA